MIYWLPWSTYRTPWYTDEVPHGAVDLGELISCRPPSEPHRHLCHEVSNVGSVPQKPICHPLTCLSVAEQPTQPASAGNKTTILVCWGSCGMHSLR